MQEPKEPVEEVRVFDVTDKDADIDPIPESFIPGPLNSKPWAEGDRPVTPQPEDPQSED